MRTLLIAISALLLTAAPAAAHGVEGAITHFDTRAELAFVDVAATAAAAAVPDALPYEWCGEARTTDDTAHAALPASSPRFKLVYAHPADRPDRFDGWRNALQGNVALIQRFLASQSGGAKALRVDMGTSCGPQYVDIQVVHLSGPRSQYVDNFSAIVREVEPRLGSGSGPRNVVILADTLNGGGYDYGLGENVLGSAGDRRGSGNVHNYGGFASVLFSRDGLPAPGAGARSWWPEGFLHEISHNLGAVQWSSPHSTQPAGFSLPRYGHCWQGADVMCYVEDGGAAHAMQYDCPRVGGAIPQAYDCGRDDYFNPAPPAGSYLATHWNVYDSAFLAPCAQIAPACGGGTDGLAPTPPVATASPELSRLTAPRRLGRRARRRLAQRPADLQLPLAAPEAQALDEHLRRHARVLRAQARRPRPPAARPGGGHQPGRQRVGRLRAELARVRRHGRQRAELHQRSVLQGPSSTACCQVPRS